MKNDTQKVIRHSITHFLSRREHGFFELTQKLAQKGFDESDIVVLLEQFKQSDIQSDYRFAQMRIRSGVSKGQGLKRIKEGVKQLRVDQQDFARALSECEVDWFELAHTVKVKRFGENIVSDPKDKAKQQRFLQYRGFSFEQIDHALTNTTNL